VPGSEKRLEIDALKLQDICGTYGSLRSPQHYQNDPGEFQEALLQRRNFFRQLAANRIDDAGHRPAGVKPNGRIDPAWKKQIVSPVCLSQESRGFGLRDNKRGIPGSDGASKGH